MYCPECKQEYEGKFCPECGTKLIERVVKICPNCGVEREGKFCPECGTKLVEQNQASVSISIGDANAINGNVNISNTVNASCNADVLGAMGNESVVIGDGNAISGGLNISNTKNLYYTQKNELELIQENKERYMALFQKAYEDGVLNNNEICELQTFRKQNGLDDISDEYYRKSLLSVGTEKVSLLQKSAELGHASACCELGCCFHQGAGVRKDCIEAIRWWRIAAAFGNDKASYILGKLYFDGDEVTQDFHEAAKWFEKAAECNYIDSWYLLGACYGNIEKYSDAVECFLKALVNCAPNRDLYRDLAYCYDEGLGVEQNYTEAFELYLKSAEMGDAIACYNVGDYYAEGRPGVEISLIEAHRWFVKAHYVGDEDAINRIKEVEDRYLEEHGDDYSTEVHPEEYGIVDEQGAVYAFNKLLRIWDRTITSLTVAEGTKVIKDGVFKFRHCGMDLERLNKVSLPQGLKVIGDEAFYGFSNLQEIILPEGIESIGIKSFYRCESLNSLTLPSTLKNIGDEAFAYCSHLSEVVFSEGVESIGREAFSGCKSLRSISLPSTLKEIGNEAFNCYNLEEVVIPRCIESIVKSCDLYCLTKLVYID